MKDNKKISEAMELFNYASASNAQEAMELFKAYMEKCNTGDEVSDFGFALGLVYHAGLVEGIRQERNKNKHKKTA